MDGLLGPLLLLVWCAGVVGLDSAPSENSSNWDRLSEELEENDEGAQAIRVPGIREGSHRYHINDGFFYHRQRSNGGRVFLRCVLARANPPCRARAVMNEDLSGFMMGDLAHNHGPDQYHERVQQLRDSLLEACRARPNVRVEIIYHDVCRNVQRDVSSRVSLLSVRPSMIRAQSAHRPNIPYSFEALDEVMENSRELRSTLDGQDEFYRGLTGEPGHRSLVFVSRRVVEAVAGARFLFGDGTFYSRPNQPDSAQLYSFVTTRDNHVIPVMHALMESRTAQAYRALFQYFRRLAPNIDPDYLMTDFEVSQQQALREVFPRARLCGCLWHYARAICRNVRSQGMYEFWRDNQNARRIVRLCIAIPLAPVGRLQEALNAVTIEARRLLVLDRFVNFLQYIRQTWILGVGEETLSVFGVRHRTNNVAECHHRNLNSRVVRRPNIWRFLEMLSESEDLAWRDLGRIELGMSPSRARRVTSVMSDVRIRSCCRQLINREMDMTHFLSSVSWHLDGAMQDILTEREDDRPPSPDRGPPPIPILEQRRMSEPFCHIPSPHDRGLRRSLPSAAVGAEVDFDFLLDDIEVVRRPPGNINVHSIDSSDLFESLIRNEEVDVSAGPQAVQAAHQARGRRLRRGRPRGRRTQAVPRSDTRARPISPVDSHERHCDQQPLSDDEVQRSPAASSPRPPAINLPLLRCEEFSDEELVPEGEPDHQRRWTECMICYARVGRYSILGCGAYPICGSCIRRWFITSGHRNCPHCGRENALGWIRLNFE